MRDSLNSEQSPPNARPLGLLSTHSLTESKPSRASRMKNQRFSQHPLGHRRVGRLIGREVTTDTSKMRMSDTIRAVCPFRRRTGRRAAASPRT